MLRVKFITKCENLNFLLIFQIFSAFTFWLGIRYELVNSMDLGFKTNWSIVWVITGRRGVSSECRHSSSISVLYFCNKIEWCLLLDNEKLFSYEKIIHSSDWCICISSWERMRTISIPVRGKSQSYLKKKLCLIKIILFPILFMVTNTEHLKLLQFSSTAPIQLV